jgi:hypothetical protein
MTTWQWVGLIVVCLVVFVVLVRLIGGEGAMWALLDVLGSIGGGDDDD